jgi:N-methylhydantoinase A
MAWRIDVDSGRTFTDVALLSDGECRLSAEANVHGYSIKAPMLEIHTVGAGGGSIGYIDGRLPKVGLRSAGADPGPVCYRLGSTEPTVTDANVLLGWVNPRYLPGGRMAIRRDLAREAIRGLAVIAACVPARSSTLLSRVRVVIARHWRATAHWSGVIPTRVESTNKPRRTCIYSAASREASRSAISFLVSGNKCRPYSMLSSNGSKPRIRNVVTPTS